MEDHPPVNDLDNQHGPRFQHGREDPTNRLDTFMNPSYSPLRLQHHNQSHYNPNLGGNFNPNSARQYHQEHALYGGYHHPQNYYYPNPYEPHFMQPLHESAIDTYHHHHADLMDSHGDDPLSVLLSNDPAKQYKPKPMQNAGAYVDPNMRKHSYGGYPTYEQDNEEEIFHDYKRQPMIKIQPEMLRNSNNLSKPQMSGINMNPSDLELKSTEPKRLSGAVRYNSRPDPNPMPQEKMESFMEDDDGMDDDAEGKGRSTRGLRILSLKVKDIVTQKKRTSYKEVAESLTYELRQKSTVPKSIKEEVT